MDHATQIYSCNEGNYSLWDAPTKAFVDECKNKPTPYSARYVGSMVSDVHRTLLYGGIFLYPADSKVCLSFAFECITRHAWRWTERVYVWRLRYQTEQVGQAASAVRSEPDVVHR